MWLLLDIASAAYQHIQLMQFTIIVSAHGPKFHTDFSRRHMGRKSIQRGFISSFKARSPSTREVLTGIRALNHIYFIQALPAIA